MCEHGAGEWIEVLDEGEWKKKNIDNCMTPLIRELNKHNIETLSCCCGHGKTPAHILINEKNVEITWINGLVRISLYSRGPDGLPPTLRRLKK